jgi:hypothetical protein
MFFLCYIKVTINSFITFCERLKNEPDNSDDSYHDESNHNSKGAYMNSRHLIYIMLFLFTVTLVG